MNEAMNTQVNTYISRYNEIDCIVKFLVIDDKEKQRIIFKSRSATVHFVDVKILEMCINL